jgi:Zn finger protein HypA/HybF involved in hydrogenase expression
MRTSKIYIIHCNKCRHAYKDRDNYTPRCPKCGSSDGEVIDVEELYEEVEYEEDKRV